MKKVYPLAKKFSLFIILTLLGSSIFAFVPTLVIQRFLEEKRAAPPIEDATNFNGHPLVGISDNTSICPNDGSEMHEIYLCGTNDTRLLAPNIPTAQSIVWEKLDEGSCPEVIENCARRSAQCTWQQMSSNTQYTVEEGGEYRIVVTYLNGTFDRFYFNVLENGLNPSPLITNVDCGTDGSITVNNVSDNYEFSINSGIAWQDDNTFIVPNAGLYNILIRRKDNANGCVFHLDDIEVNNNSFDAMATVIPITCNTSKGEVLVEIADASSNYIYKIYQGGNLVQSSGPIAQNDYTFDNLNPGNYNIEVTLASVSSCNWTSNITVEPFTPMVPSVVVTKNVDCGPGTITANITGGVAPYQYSMNGNPAFEAFTNGNQTIIPIASPGTFTISIRDANGCLISANPVQVVEEQTAEYTVAKEDNKCSGVNDGEITFNVTNPRGFSITFSIDDGITFRTTKTFKNLAPGSYQTAIKMEKAGGECIEQGPLVSIEAATPFEVEASITQQIDCTNGSASLAANVTSGEATPFLYSLNGIDYQTTPNFSGLGPGSYTITVKDNNDCTTSTDIDVLEGNDPSNITFEETNYNCNDGSVDVALTVIDGTAPFQYEITAPISRTSSSNVFTGLEPGTYTFEVTAADGCRIVRNYNVSDPIRLQLTSTLLNQVSCINATSPNGRLSFTVTDFIDNYDYTVTDSSNNVIAQAASETTNTVELDNLAPSEYTIAVTNLQSGCVIEKSIVIEEPAQALTVDSLDVVPYNCGQEGSVRINATGGWGGYSYWLELPDGGNTAVQNTPLIVGLDQEGTHRVFVIDINGCVTSETTFDLVYNDGPDLELDLTNSNFCYRTDNKGELTYNIVNGVEPLSYVVNGADPVPISAGTTTFTLADLSPDTYSVKVVDGTGCFTEIPDVQISGQLFVTPSLTRILGCGALTDAAIQLNVQGGYPPYTYEVSRDGGLFQNAASTFNTPDPGSYAFRITDNKGCVFTTEALVIEPRREVLVDTQLTLTRCGLDGTGAVLFEPTSGVAPFEYSFDGGPFTNQPLYTGLDAQDYNYVVRDAALCEFAGTVSIGAEPAISFNVVNEDSECPATPGGRMQYGHTIISMPENVQGDIDIELVRVRNQAHHESTGWEHVFRNYQGIDPTTEHQVADQFEFKIRMFWEAWFYVRITDSRGCIYISDYYFHDQPDLPTTYAGPARDINGDLIDQNCANGGPLFDVEINNTSDLVGPFEYIIWPRNLEDLDNDGEPEISGWKAFDDPANAHPLYDPNIMNINVRLGPPRDNLIFGVHYRILVRDLGTGCLRWSNVGQIEAPTPSINVEVVTRGAECWGETNGRARFTVTDHDQTGDIEYRIYDAWRVNQIFQDWTSVPGNATTVEFEVGNFPVRWWVVEVRDASGCVVGERFVTHRADAQLELELLHKQDASCTFGGQIAVDALGGWYNERRFNWLNRMDYYPWREYQYAYVPLNETLDDGDWTFESSVVVNPAAFDGTSNVYRVYTRDANNCVVELPSTVTIDLEPLPEIAAIDVPDRCSITNEKYTVNAAATGGVGNLEYIWNGEITTSSTKVLSPGTHTLQIKDENGCSDSQTFTIYPRFNAALATTQKVACDPADNGEVTIEVYGGSGDFSFEQIAPAGGASNNTGVFGGLSHSILYEFRVTDNISGCPDQVVSITLDAPQTPLFEVKTPVQNVSCAGADDGKIIVLPQLGSNQVDAPYTYSLDGINYQASNLFQDLPPGNYTVRVRSGLNCVQTLPSIPIIEPAELSLGNTSISPFACTANNTLGMATIEASVEDNLGNLTGTAPYLFSFNGASFTQNNTLTVPYTNVDQTITIEVRDGSNCTDQTTITVPAATKVLATLVETQPMNCVDDAVIEVVGSNGSGNYEIVELPSGNLINGTGSGVITIPTGNPGNYVYRLTDLDTGCFATVNYEILDYDTLNAQAIKSSDVSCFGGNDGSVQLALSGYDGNYSYTLFDSSGTAIASEPNENTSSGMLSFDNLIAGGYYFVVTALDSPYCSRTTTTITVQSPALELEVEGEVVTELSCVPGNDAEIIVSATGGWTGYQYQLSNAVSGDILVPFTSDDVFSGLESGLYMVTVRDINGCTAQLTDPVEVAPITQIDVDDNPTLTPISCIGAADGSITVTASGGQGLAFYSYVLNNLTTGVSSVPQASNTFENLVPGRYSVTVKDNKGCDATSVEILFEDPFEVVLEGSITLEPTCTEDGAITVSAGGGSGDYEFSYFELNAGNVRGQQSAWSNETTYQLPSGTYEFIARDLHFGCESPLSVVRSLREVEPLSITLNTQAALLNCNGDSDAVISAQAFGGIGAYYYELQDGEGNAIGDRKSVGTFEGLGAGTYRVAAYSDPDCYVLSEPVDIIDPNPLEAEIAAIEFVNCFGEDTGSAVISANGGNAPYTYILSTEVPKVRESNRFEHLGVGSYSVLVQDATGCEIEVEFIIEGPAAPLSVTVNEVNHEICSGDATGSFTLSVSGGTAPYEYNTTSPNGPFYPIQDADDVLFENLNGGTSHVVFIRDANGCSQTHIQEINVGVNLSSSVETTYSCKDGAPFSSTAVNLVNPDLIGEVLYILDSDDINLATPDNNFESLSEGGHYVNIVHSGGCMVATETFTIEPLNPISVEILPGDLNEIRFVPSGGDGSYTYFVNDEPISETSHYIVRSGNYTIKVIDGQGCEGTAEVFMDFIDIEIPNFFTPDGDGMNDVWYIKNASGYNNLYVAIFDRYGRKLKSFIRDGEWDGSYEGVDLPAGDYWYVIKLNHKDDDREFVGNFTIYR